MQNALLHSRCNSVYERAPQSTYRTLPILLLQGFRI